VLAQALGHAVQVGAHRRELVGREPGGVLDVALDLVRALAQRMALRGAGDVDDPLVDARPLPRDQPLPPPAASAAGTGSRCRGAAARRCAPWAASRAPRAAGARGTACRSAPGARARRGRRRSSPATPCTARSRAVRPGRTPTGGCATCRHCTTAQRQRSGSDRALPTARCRFHYRGRRVLHERLLRRRGRRARRPALRRPRSPPTPPCAMTPPGARSSQRSPGATSRRWWRRFDAPAEPRSAERVAAPRPPSPAPLRQLRTGRPPAHVRACAGGR
jgi:hypothetical protein